MERFNFVCFYFSCFTFFFLVSNFEKLCHALCLGTICVGNVNKTVAFIKLINSRIALIINRKERKKMLPQFTKDVKFLDLSL